ncbi:unnamed protein product, partial [Closterium sp. NIES-53]
AEGDCYLSVPPDLGIEAAALGASDSAASGTGESATPGAGKSALSSTAPTEALHTFTLDCGASRSFFCDSTKLTPLSRPDAVSLADPFGGSVLAHSSTILPCPAAPSGLLSGLHLPSFSTNLVSGADLQDAWVDHFTPGVQRVTHCTCSRTGRHLATFTRRPGSSLYTLTTAPPPIAASGQVFSAASRFSPVSAPCSCHPLAHETLLWHHRLGHPSLPRLQGLPSRTLVSGLPRPLPPLSPRLAPTCVPRVEGRQRATPHSSEFPPIEAPLQTLHMDVWGPARVHGQGHKRYFLLVVDDYSCYTTVFPLRSKDEVNEGIRQTFTLLASPQQNGIAEHRIGLVMDAARSSMIHAAAPHFLWPFAVQYAAHQINLQPRVSLPETTPTLRWTGKVGDASVFHPVELVEVAVDSGDARGAQPTGARTGGVGPGVAVSEGAEPGGAELERWYTLCFRRDAGAGAAGGASGSAGGASGAGAAGGAAGAGAAGGTTDPGGTGAGGTGAVGAAGGARAAGPGGARTGGTGAAAAGGASRVGAACAGAVATRGAVGVTGAGGATGQLQPASPQPGPSPYFESTRDLTERREPESHESRSKSPVRAVCTSRRVPRQRPPPVPGTHSMTQRPSTAPQRVPLLSPPASSLPEGLDPESLRDVSPSVTRFLATAVTDPLFQSTAASALVAKLVDFAAAFCLDYTTSLVAKSTSASICPPSVGGEYALATDVLENRQEEFECFAAALPHLVSMLLAPEGDPDAPDIPTSHSYAEMIEGPYSSQWQAAMDAKMASWKSTRTYVHEVPLPGANIVRGMWIFKVKRSPGSPPVFKARYVARGFSQRQGVDFFHTFSPTPKMTTLRVLLHVAAQRDYELHSLDFSTAFLQGSLHEEIWLRRPPGFTGTTLGALGFAPSTADPSLFLRTDTTLPPFYVLVYIDDLVFATADTEALAHVNSKLAQRTSTLTRSHMVQQVLQRVGFTHSLPQSTPLPTGHSLSAPPLDESVEPSGPYPELVGCLITSGMGLVRGGQARVVLTGHADASWVDNLATQRSSQGYTFSLSSSSVSWRSIRSSSVLSSSCEAEIYAGAMAAQELCWLTYLLTDLGEAPRSPPQRGQLRLAYVTSQANTADVFTKALQPCDHQPCFAFLDWSCDLLFSPTLPMGSIYWTDNLSAHPPLPTVHQFPSLLNQTAVYGCASTTAHRKIHISHTVHIRPTGPTAWCNSLFEAGPTVGLLADQDGGQLNPQDDVPYQIRLLRILGDAVRTLQRTSNALGRDEPHPTAPVGRMHMDDILIYSKNIKERMELLRKVFEILRKNKFYVKLSKIDFALKKVQFLGHMVVSLDFITGLPSTSRGQDAILVVIDKFSKMGHFIPTNATAIAQATAHHFFDLIITIHGIPATLISDRDPKFTINLLCLLDWSCDLLFSPTLPMGSGGLTVYREPASSPFSHVRAARRLPRSRPPPVPGTHAMTLRPSSIPLPTVSRLLSIAVTGPTFESAAASVLIAELLDFAAACRLECASALVAESEFASPPSIGGECALGTDVLEDRQEDFECLAATVPRFASMLLALEGDPDAPDIPTPRSYAEAITGPYSSQWQAAMDAEMASWKSTGTYVDEVPPPGANIVDGMWICRVKWPLGSPPAFKARYVARGFSQQQGVDYFQTISPTPKMTTLQVLLHVAAQRDYELHSLYFSTALLQGSLHEEI